MKNFHSDFDAQFARAEKFHGRFMKFVIGMIAIMFVAMLCWWGFVGYVAFTSVDAVNEQGLKSVIERIWCGPGKSCL